MTLTVDTAYRVTSQAYLARARRRLDDGTPEGLFYAAFELRCGIQGRLQEYLEARKELAEKRRQGWRIPQLAKDFERVFRTGDQVVRLSITSLVVPGSLILYFTPVSRRLQEMAGRLNELLHAQPKQRSDGDPWWEKQRRFLEVVYRELQKAVTGALLGPPLLNRRTKLVDLNFAFPGDAKVPEVRQFLESAGAKLRMRVQYLRELPDDVTDGVTVLRPV